MNKGFAAIFIVVITFLIVFSLLSVFLLRQDLAFLNNFHASWQTKYLAESGIEDALLRIKQNPFLTDFSYSFEPERGRIEVEIWENNQGNLNIISQAYFLDFQEGLKIEYKPPRENISFSYAAQAQEEGVIIKNNSVIKGDVFSLGNIESQEAFIDGSVRAYELKNALVEKNAQAYNCLNSEIKQDLFFIDKQNCQVGGQIERKDELEEKEFALSENIIQDWQEQAKQGEIIEENYQVENNDYLGPAYIKGDLEINNGASLSLQGVVLVEGDLIIKNNGTLKLDQDYYKFLSGSIIVQGKTQIKPEAELKGSGEEESYFLIISLNESLQSAVEVSSKIDQGIFYAPNGTVKIKPEGEVAQISAYKIILEQNSKINYQNNLENLFFLRQGEILSWEKIK